MAKQPDLKIPKVVLLPSGSYSTKVMIDGKRHTITRDSAEEVAAEAIAIKYGVKMFEKKLTQGKVTLEEALDSYIKKREDKKSPATIRAYNAYKKNRLRNMMSRNVFSVTDAQWQVAIDREFRNLSDKYAKNVWSLFASAIEEVTGRRPKVEMESPKKADRPYLEPDEILKFVEAVKGTSVEIAALLELSSLRISEVLDVRGTDVDLQRNRILVAGAAVVGAGGKLIHKESNKTVTSRRYVPIIPPLREVLEKTSLTDDYLVTMSGNCVYRRINEICRENDLPEVGNHGLRHSFASLAYHLQIPEKIAMEIGGWSDDGTMRKIYTHLAQKDIENRSKDFSDFFKPSV